MCIGMFMAFLDVQVVVSSQPRRGVALEQFHDKPLGLIDGATNAIVKPLIKRITPTQSPNEARLLLGGFFVVALLLFSSRPKQHLLSVR
jgi:hypothetical protein